MPLRPLALLTLLPSLALASPRAVTIDGKPLSFPSRADAAPPESPQPLNLLVSADEPSLLATLLHGGWTPRDRRAHPAHREPSFSLSGLPPDLDLERGGARIDERLRLLLWRRPERPRGLPLWAGVALKQGGVAPLKAASLAPRSSGEARDRVLAALAYGLAQAREVGAAAPGLPRLSWVELADPPPGAMELLEDLPDEPPGPGDAPEVPLLADLPAIERVSAEVIARPERAGRRVALTFDACSTLDRSFYDARVTAALRAAHAPATLFISGRWAESHLAQMRDLAKDPLFEIANHSYIHPHLTEVSPERQREELLWTQQILLSLTGRLPRFFRPPYGELDPALAEVAAEAGLRTVEFDFPSGDPDRKITKERLVAWVLAKARPGSIVVMHMNRHGWHTAEALPEIIAGLRARGFVLSTVGALVDADAAARATPRR